MIRAPDAGVKLDTPKDQILIMRIYWSDQPLNGHVAEELGLPPWWLNEQASVYVSGKDDPGKRRVFDHPNLRIMVASPEHIFAMKARAARTRDIDDLRSLAPLADVHTVDDALRICRDFYPDEEVSSRARGVLKELFE